MRNRSLAVELEDGYGDPQVIDGRGPKIISCSFSRDKGKYTYCQGSLRPPRTYGLGKSVKLEIDLSKIDIHNQKQFFSEENIKQLRE
jgi:hypothetical protein